MLGEPKCDCDKSACSATQRSWPSFENALRMTFYCPYCGVDLDGSDGIFSTKDHIVPRSRGGGNRASNLVKACPRCNGDKGNKTLLEWLWILERDGNARARWIRRFLKCKKRKRVLDAMRVMNPCQ